jgi:hypothetical protein
MRMVVKPGFISQSDFGVCEAPGCNALTVIRCEDCWRRVCCGPHAVEVGHMFYCRACAEDRRTVVVLRRGRGA